MTDRLPSLRRFWRRLFAVCFALTSTSLGVAQALPLLSVTTPYRDAQGEYTLNPVLAPGAGNFLLDPINDHQTGQGHADFLSTPQNAGFFVQFGTLTPGGPEVIMFRFIFADYRNQGFSSNIRIGIDANRDGKVDIFFGPTLGNTNQTGIWFQDADPSKANVSPSTTGLTNNYGRVLITNNNFNYSQVSIDNVTRGMVTFALEFETLASTLNAATGIEITPDTFLRYVAFTSTQSNSINQDVMGTPNSSSSTIRYDAPGGGFSEYIDASGAPIPEPSSYGALLMSLLVGLGVCRRRNLRPARA